MRKPWLVTALAPCLSVTWAAPAPVAVDVPEVITVPVHERSLERELIGITVPDRRLEVAFEVSGTVASPRRDLGAKLKPGELIIALDERRAFAEVQLARSQLATARADLTLARLQLQRAREAADYLAQEDVDIALARHERAVAQAESFMAQLAIAEVNLSKHRLTAPFEGVLTDQTPLPGSQVAANDVVAALVSSALRIRAEITPRELDAIQTGTGSMRILHPETGGEPFPVAHTIAAVAVADETTGLTLVHLAVPACSTFVAGELVELGFFREKPQVDPRIVRTDAAGKYLLLVEDERIQRISLADVRLRPAGARAVLFGPDELDTGDRVRAVSSEAAR